MFAKMIKAYLAWGDSMKEVDKIFSTVRWFNSYFGSIKVDYSHTYSTLCIVWTSLEERETYLTPVYSNEELEMYLKIRTAKRLHEALYEEVELMIQEAINYKQERRINYA